MEYFPPQIDSAGTLRSVIFARKRSQIRNRRASQNGSVFGSPGKGKASYHFWCLQSQGKTGVEVPETLKKRYCSGERGGITISRRPNKRPSTENAPGPSKAMPMAVTNINAATKRTPNDARGGAGIQERVMAKTHKATTKLASGVMNPTIKPSPLRSSIAETLHTRTEWWLKPERYKPPRRTAIPPRAARNSSRPIPGRPLGNVENSLCSGTLPRAQTTTARHGNYPLQADTRNPP